MKKKKAIKNEQEKSPDKKENALQQVEDNTNAVLTKIDLYIIIALTVISFLIRILRLSVPSAIIFDEEYYAPSAQSYLFGREDPNWVHPPLAKMLMSVGILFFGYNALGWRFMGVLLGTLMVVIVYLWARKMKFTPFYATIAGLLLSLDFLHFVQSRIATLDIYVSFFVLLACFTAHLYLTAEETKADKFIYLSAVSFGMALACKWSALFIIWLYIIPFFKSKLKKAVFVILVCYFIAFNVYAVTYIPYFRLGKVSERYASLMHNYKSTAEFHARLNLEHPYVSKWWSWPLVIRPIWYEYKEDKAKKTVKGIVAMGSPIFWWMSIAALLALFGQAIFFRRQEEAFLFLCYFFNYFLWISSLKGGFFYYMTPCVPFMALAVAYWLNAWKDRVIDYTYMVLVIFFFIWFYPFIASYPIPTTQFNWRIWFPNWV